MAVCGLCRGRGWMPVRLRNRIYREACVRCNGTGIEPPRDAAAVERARRENHSVAGHDW